MNFKPRKSLGAWYGLLVGVMVFGICLWGIYFSLSGAGDLTLKLMLLIPAYIFLAVYVLFLLAAFTLKYTANDKGLLIKAGIRRVFIPYKDINEIINVTGNTNIFSIIGAKWPGFKIGLFNVRGIGPMRLYATKMNKGFIYIKSASGLIGITPEDHKYQELLTLLAGNSGKEAMDFDLNQIPEEEKGTNVWEDNFYRLLLKINLFLLLAYGAYMAIFFPGSSSPDFIMLLPVLAIALLCFNIGNAERLYQFNSGGGYALLALSIFVTGIFFILSLGEISL